MRWALAGLAVAALAVVWWWGRVPRAEPAWLEVQVEAVGRGAAVGALVTATQADSGHKTQARAAAAGERALARLGPLSPGTVSLRVDFAGAMPYELAQVVVAAPQTSLRVSLQPSTVIEGAVVDDAGTPLASAELLARRDNATKSDPISTVEFRTTSDAQGHFRFAALPPDTYTLQARSDLHELAVVPNVTAPSKDPARVVLQRTAALQGEVLDNQGRPAASAQVTIAGSGVWPPKTLTADAHGRFALSPVPAGVYELRAKRTTFTSPPREGVVVEPAASAFVRLMLEPGVVLRGHAFDAESGVALRGVAVTVGEDALSAVPNHATTAADGTFAIDGLRALPHRLWMHAPGYVPVTGEPMTPREQAYEFPLRRAAVLSGVVVDESNTPVADAELEITGTTDAGQPVQVLSVAEPTFGLGKPVLPQVPSSGDSLGVTSGVIPKIPLFALPADAAAGSLTPDLGFRTDAQGRFRIEGVPPGKVQLAARKWGFALGTSAPRSVRSGDRIEDLRIVLPLGGSVVGHVVDARGFPIASARVQLQIAGDRAPRVTLTRDDGYFAFAAVLRGACTVTAFALNGASVKQELTIAANESRVLDLVLDGETRTLLGRVLDPRGFPIAGALVHLDLDGARAPIDRSTQSGDDGTFQLTALPLPPYRVRVEHVQYGSAVLRATSPKPGEELAITLHPGATVTGLVLDQMTNDGIDKARVRLRGRSASATMTTQTNARGAFEIPNVTLDTYEVIVDEPQHVTGRAKAVLTEPGRREIDPIALQPAGMLSGDVVDRIGSPVFNAEVAVGQPPAWAQAARTDHRGHFALVGVAPGDQRLSARHPQAGTTGTPVPARVYPRQETPGLVLRLPERPTE